MRDWNKGTQGRWVTMGIRSDGSYGIPEGLIYGMPCTCAGGKYHVVKGLEIDHYSREKMDATLAELSEERDGVKHLFS
jgi:malate dehydrogenase